MYFYTYDANGNRVLVDGTESYTTGDNNQTTSDGTYTYLYDAEGNLQFRYVDADSSETINSGDTDITEYVWDHRNRLTEVADYASFSLFSGETPDSVVDYIYDCFNHRVASLYDTDGDSDLDLEERYAWQGKNVALDFIDSDGDGATESLELTHRYLWGQMVDQLLAQETYDDGGVEDVLYPVRDNLGSTRSLIDHTGDIAATYSYDSFGNVTVLVGSLTDARYLYTCQEYDLTLGFYYYDARWYDPAVGKFISEDPIAEDLNLYRYVGNSPILYVDPSGLFAWCAGISGDIGGGFLHPMIALKVCWDDCGNMAVAATVVSAAPINGQEGLVPAVISTFMGMSVQAFGEVSLTKNSCVKDMGGVFFEFHCFGSTEVPPITVEGGIEVTPGLDNFVIQGGVGVGLGGGLPALPGGVKLQRTYTFMATCTENPCPCCHPWYDVRQYLGPNAGALYFPEAQSNCAASLTVKLVDWLKKQFSAKPAPPVQPAPRPAPAVPDIPNGPLTPLSFPRAWQQR